MHLGPLPLRVLLQQVAPPPFPQLVKIIAPSVNSRAREALTSAVISWKTVLAGLESVVQVGGSHHNIF